MPDTASDATPDDSSPNDVDQPDSSMDIASDGSGDVSCQQTWQTGGGEERCCGLADLSCDLLDFSNADSASSFDPSTDVFTVKVDRSLAELDGASVSATITTGQGGGMGGGRFVSEVGTLDGETITFDFSGYDYAEDEVLQLDSISLEDTCGNAKQLLIGNTVDPRASTETIGFDCDPVPDF
jgi:hypothetical protein